MYLIRSQKAKEMKMVLAVFSLDYMPETWHHRLTASETAKKSAPCWLFG